LQLTRVNLLYELSLASFVPSYPPPMLDKFAKNDKKHMKTKRGDREGKEGSG